MDRINEMDGISWTMGKNGWNGNRKSGIIYGIIRVDEQIDWKKWQKGKKRKKK